MKNILIILTILLIPASVYLQENHDSLVEDANSYLSALEKRDVQKLLRYVYLPGNDQFRLEELQQTFERVFNDTTLVTSYSRGTIVKASESIEVDHLKYRTVFFTIQLNLSLPEWQESSLSLEILRSQYGDHNVIYNSKEHLITVKIIDYLYAIKPEQSKQWKFLAGNSTSWSDDLIPQNVIDYFAVEIISWISNRI